MELHSDFTQRVAVHSQQIAWEDSPTAGVSRRMLDRIGDEVARATTIVRFDSNSLFPAHIHNGGEEFFVLEGIFQDEHGDYPPGSYIRNPPQSKHTPGSAEGCVIFVKLWQFDPADRQHVYIDTNREPPTVDVNRQGVSTIPLYTDEREEVRLETWSPGANITVDASAGAELLVISGSFVENQEIFQQHSWLRSPMNSQVNAVAGPDGACVWIKTKHLRFTQSSTFPKP